MNLPNALSVARIVLVPVLVSVLLTKFEGRLVMGTPVELVAAEPNIVNPVAMTFDERGRIWITESLEYPRKSAGPGAARGA